MFRSNAERLEAAERRVKEVIELIESCWTPNEPFLPEPLVYAVDALESAGKAVREVIDRSKRKTRALARN